MRRRAPVDGRDDRERECQERGSDRGLDQFNRSDGLSDPYDDSHLEDEDEEHPLVDPIRYDGLPRRECAAPAEELRDAPRAGPVWVEGKVGRVEDGKPGPEAVDGGGVVCELAEDEGEDGEGGAEGECRVEGFCVDVP